jgi:adenylosuccinate synthase
MSCTIVVGTQFGDEGKGKIVDYYSDDVDIIVRYNGGSNAGHTVVINGEKFAFSLLPSGVLRKEKIVVIGNGVVLDPEVIFREINDLEKRGITPAKIMISDRAHVVMPYHKIMDAAQEKIKGSLSAGTTKRGIGPCYSDKVARFGIRTCDLLDERVLKEKLDVFIPLQENLLSAYGEKIRLSKEELYAKFYGYGLRLSEYVTDTSSFLNEAISKGKKILLEGAQGTHLDIDWGIYPYGTSSNVVSGGACTGSGIPPTKIGPVIGVVKAYTSRVGTGPFPAELTDEVGEFIRERGGEYGTVTGRPRRCGWLDLVMLRHSIQINGVSHIALTKIDVLSGLNEIKICVTYEHNGDEVKNFPANMRFLSECSPIYVTLAGWKEFSMQEWFSFLKSGYESLPHNLKEYIKYVEKSTNTPITLLSFGPDRDLTMML